MTFKHIRGGGERSQGKSFEEEPWKAEDNFRKNLRQKDAIESILALPWRTWSGAIYKVLAKEEFDLTLTLKLILLRIKGKGKGGGRKNIWEIITWIQARHGN